MDTDGIDLRFAENDAAAFAAQAWHRTTGLGPRLAWFERWWRVAAFGIYLVGTAALGLLVNHLLGAPLELGPAAALGVLALGWVPYWWNPRLARAMRHVHDAGGLGDTHAHIDAQGVAFEDNLRQWRLDWRAVTALRADAHGLAFATRGLALYVPASAWPDAAARERDAARVTAWWRAATGKAA